MAWTPIDTNETTNVGGYTSGAITLPSSATIGYTPVIEFLGIRKDTEKKYVTIVATASAVSGTNVDLSLYGSLTATGEKFLLLDLNSIVADITNSAKTKAGVLDINAYPAPYYYLAHTTDADESANTITYSVIL